MQNNKVLKKLLAVPVAAAMFSVFGVHAQSQSQPQPVGKSAAELQAQELNSKSNLAGKTTRDGTIDNSDSQGTEEYRNGLPVGKQAGVQSTGGQGATQDTGSGTATAGETGASGMSGASGMTGSSGTGGTGTSGAQGNEAGGGSGTSGMSGMSGSTGTSGSGTGSGGQVIDDPAPKAATGIDSSASAGAAGAGAAGAAAALAGGGDPATQAGGVDPAAAQGSSGAAGQSGSGSAAQGSSGSAAQGSSGSSAQGSSGAAGQGSSGAAGQGSSGAAGQGSSGAAGQGSSGMSTQGSMGATGAAGQAAAGGKLSKGDEKILMDMARANIDEIEAGKVAQSKSQNDQVKSFAQQMIDDHSKALSDVQSVAQSKGVTLPTEPDSKHKTMVAKLEKLSGESFDKAYMANAGISDHKKVLSELKKAGKNAKDPDVKGLADKMTPVVEQHLKSAEQMPAVKPGTTSGK